MQQAKSTSKSVPWLTLFFDLIVVTVVSRATSVYESNPTWLTVGFVFVTMLVIYVLWAVTTVELMLSPVETWPRRVLVMIQVFALLVAALAMYRGGGISDRWGFAALCVAFASVAALSWMRSREIAADTRWAKPLSRVMLLASGIFGLGSLFPMGATLNESGYLVAWIFFPLGMLVATVGGLIWAPRLIVTPSRLSEKETQERFGVLLLVVLGDTFLLLTEAVGSQRQIPDLTYFALTVIVVFIIWSLYFPTLSQIESPRTLRKAIAQVSAHFLLFLSSSLSVVAYVALTSEPDNEAILDSSATGAHSVWSVLPLLGIAIAILWLTWLRRGAWSQSATSHLVATLALALLFGSELLFHIESHHALAVAAMILAVDAVTVLYLGRKDELNARSATTPA